MEFSVLYYLLYVYIIGRLHDYWHYLTISRCKGFSHESRQRVRLLRNDRQYSQLLRDLVVGDVIMVETGMRIPADCIVISGEANIR